MMPVLRLFLLSLFFSLPAMAQDAPQMRMGVEETGSQTAQQPAAHEPNVEVWVPADFRTAKGPWPLIVFSHAFTSCAKQSTYLTQYLADHEYIVAAPDHADGKYCRDAMDAMSHPDLQAMPERPFRNPEEWSDQTYTARRDDIEFTIKSLLHDPQYKGLIDENRIGLMGHSLGGYTALGLAGGWSSWKDKRVKAVVLLSPHVSPYIVHGTLKNIDVPVIYQGGTLDDFNTPLMKSGNGAYAQSNAPKYFMELDGADHFSWLEKDPRFHDVIDQVTLAFFDKYLKGTEVAVLPGGKAKGVATYWQDEGKKVP